jgi:hypothetical protein
MHLTNHLPARAAPHRQRIVLLREGALGRFCAIPSNVAILADDPPTGEVVLTPRRHAQHEKTEQDRCLHLAFRQQNTGRGADVPTPTLDGVTAT